MSLREKLASDPKSLVGNKGFRKYLSIDRETVSLNEGKIEEEARFDGKWVLRTNTDFPARAGCPQVQGTLAGRAGLPGYEVGPRYEAYLPPKR